MSALVLPRRHTSSRPVMPRASRARHASKIGLRRPSTKDVAGIRHPITPAALGQADRLELNPRRAQSLLPRAVDLRLHDGVVRVAHVLLSRCWWRLFRAQSHPKPLVRPCVFRSPMGVRGNRLARTRAYRGKIKWFSNYPRRRSHHPDTRNLPCCDSRRSSSPPRWECWRLERIEARRHTQAVDDQRMITSSTAREHDGRCDVRAHSFN